MQWSIRTTDFQTNADSAFLSIANSRACGIQFSCLLFLSKWFPIVVFLFSTTGGKEQSGNERYCDTV